jgi:addiction module HigA family antidote
MWPVGLGAGTTESPARRPVPTNGNGHTNVPHPGEFLWSEYLDPLELPVNEVATALGIHRKTLSAILNGHQRITLDTAIRLAKAFDTPADEWMARQTAWDLANTDTKRIEVERLMPETDATEVQQASQDIEPLKVSVNRKEAK